MTVLILLGGLYVVCWGCRALRWVNSAICRHWRLICSVESIEELALHGVVIFSVWYVVLPQLYVLLATASQGNDFDTGIRLVHQSLYPEQHYAVVLLTILCLAALLPSIRLNLIELGLRLSAATFLLLLTVSLILWIESFCLHQHWHVYRHIWLGSCFEYLWGDMAYQTIISIRGQIGDARRSLATPAFGFASEMLLSAWLFVCWLSILPFLLAKKTLSEKAELKVAIPPF